MSEAIIVGGCPSSGTTLVRAILDSHSRISCGPELGIFDRSFIYQEPFSRLRAIMQITTKLIDEVFVVKGNDKRRLNLITEVLDPCSRYKSTTNFSPGGNSALIKFYVRDWQEAVNLALQSNSYEVFFDKMFSSFASANGKQRWAEKTPENIYFADQLLDQFTTYKFVHVLRNPLDVFTSLFFRKFSPMPFQVALNRYRDAIVIHNRCLNNPRYNSIWYEDLILNPEETIKKLMDFLGEDFEKKQLKFYLEKRESTRGYGDKALFTTSLGRWRRELKEERLEQILKALNNEKLSISGTIPSSFNDEPIIREIFNL